MVSIIREFNRMPNLVAQAQTLLVFRQDTNKIYYNDVSYINRQSSFTVKNPRVRLVKIDHVI